MTILGWHFLAMSWAIAGCHSSVTVLAANTTQIIEISTPRNLFPMVRVVYTLEVQWNLQKAAKTPKNRYNFYKKMIVLTSRIEKKNKSACIVRLLTEISTVGTGFCKIHTTVPRSIWHFRSKNGYAIFHCHEYHLDSLMVAIYHAQELPLMFGTCHWQLQSATSHLQPNTCARRFSN